MKNYTWKNKWQVQSKAQLSQYERDLLAEKGEEFEDQKKALSEDLIQRSLTDASEEEIAKLELTIAKKLEKDSLADLTIISAYIHTDLESDVFLGHVVYDSEEKRIVKEFN